MKIDAKMSAHVALPKPCDTMMLYFSLRINIVVMAMSNPVEHHSMTGDWEASWHRFSLIPIPSETMMLYFALWVRINGIHNSLNCSSFGYLHGVT